MKTSNLLKSAAMVLCMGIVFAMMHRMLNHQPNSNYQLEPGSTFAEYETLVGLSMDELFRLPRIESNQIAVEIAISDFRNNPLRLFPDGYEHKFDTDFNELKLDKVLYDEKSGYEFYLFDIDNILGAIILYCWEHKTKAFQGRCTVPFY